MDAFDRELDEVKDLAEMVEFLKRHRATLVVPGYDWKDREDARRVEQPDPPQQEPGCGEEVSDKEGKRG